MSERTYVKIASWHIVDKDSLEDDKAMETLCGLFPDEGAEVDFTLDMNEKSCETCLRLATNEG